MNEISNDQEIFKRARCGICKVRVATNLCDFVVDYCRPIFFRSYEDYKEQDLHRTCDFPMCNKCTKKFNQIYDFCPHHFKLLEKIKPTEEMEKSINEYYVKEVLEKWN